MCFCPKTKENNIISYITCVGFVSQVLNDGDWTVGCVALHFTRDNVAYKKIIVHELYTNRSFSHAATFNTECMGDLSAGDCQRS